MLEARTQRTRAHGKTSRRLLVIDDDPFYRDMAAATLDAAEYEVVAAADGAEGLELLRSLAFDVAVVDLTMPGVDGFEVIRRTRADSQNSGIPIIVITGQEDLASLEQAFDAGATSFVAKPINWPLFAHHVHFVHRAGRAEAELRDAVRTVEFLSNLKSKVLSVLVGESQLPLKTAQGMTELLRREVYGPLGHKVYQEYAEDLHRALEQLASTQLKMLNAGHALSSGLLLQEEPTGLAGIVRDGIDSLREKAARRGIELETRIAIPDDTQVMCDRALVNQAIRMLLDSSISYAPRRTSLAVDARIGADGAFSFSVHDEAPSIPDATVREILATAPPRPTDSNLPAAARNTSLTISRVLIEAHQGRMAINSTAGEGTLVRLMLQRERLGAAGDMPAARPSAPAAASSAGAQPPPVLRLSAPPARSQRQA